MAREKSPAFQFYPKDFLSDPNTAVMTARQIGAYQLLMSYVWLDGSVADDDAYLASLARLTNDEWAHDAHAIRRCFVSAEEDGRRVLRHARLDEERDKQSKWREKSSKGGQLRAKTPRRRSKAEPPCNQLAATLEPPFSHPSALQSSSSSSSPMEKTRTAAAEPLAFPQAVEGEADRPASAPHPPVDVPFPIVAALARSTLAEGKDWSYPGGEVDLVEELKIRCAKANIRYNTATIQRAVDSERHKAQHGLRRMTA